MGNMGKQSLKTRLTAYTGEFVAALLLIQPLLDVLSYFMQAAGTTVVTTGLRMALLVLVSLYGFCVSDRKQIYAALYGLIAGFWLLHALNCFRLGYQDPLGDLAEYLKLAQFPLWTMAFLTFFRRREGLDLRIIGVLAANFAIILLVVGLSYLTGRPAYTYDFPERQIQIGVLGWFGVPNAQSAIVSLLVPALLLWGLRTEKLWIFCLCTVSGLGFLYLTGTRLTFYTALLAAGAFVVLILLSRKQYWYCLPLLAAIVLLVAFRGVSPMAQRQAVSANSFALYQEKIDRVMGEDKDFVYQAGEDIPEQVREKIEEVYVDVYGGKGAFGEPLLGDMIERFGLDRVLREYEYTLRPQNLNNTRFKKLKALHMVWEDQDFLTHLLGFEYADARIGEYNYDPENDFPALLYYTGYLGIGLYGAFLVWITVYGVLAFFRRFPSLLTPEFGTAAMMFVLSLGAAQMAGQFLRRPNVTVYFSVAAAMLVYQAETAPPAERLRPGHERNPAVSLKKVKMPGPPGIGRNL